MGSQEGSRGVSRDRRGTAVDNQINRPGILARITGVGGRAWVSRNVEIAEGLRPSDALLKITDCTTFEDAPCAS